VNVWGKDYEKKRKRDGQKGKPGRKLC